MQHEPRALSAPQSAYDKADKRHPVAIPPLVYSIAQACRMSSLGRTSVYARIRSGELEITKIGRRTLIHAASMHELLGIKD